MLLYTLTSAISSWCAIRPLKEKKLEHSDDQGVCNHVNCEDCWAHSSVSEQFKQSAGLDLSFQNSRPKSGHLNATGLQAKWKLCYHGSNDNPVNLKLAIRMEKSQVQIRSIWNLCVQLWKLKDRSPSSSNTESNYKITIKNGRPKTSFSLSRYLEKSKYVLLILTITNIICLWLLTPYMYNRFIFCFKLMFTVETIHWSQG